MQLEHNFSAATISKAFPLKKLCIFYLAFHVLTSYQQLFPCPFLSFTFVSFASSLPLFLFLLLHFSSFPFVYLLASFFLLFRLPSLSPFHFFSSLMFSSLSFPLSCSLLPFPFFFFSSLHLLASCLSPFNPLFYSPHSLSFFPFLSMSLCLWYLSHLTYTLAFSLPFLLLSPLYLPHVLNIQYIHRAYS